MELKQRMWHTAECLHKVLPKNFKFAISTMLKIVEVLKERKLHSLGLELMFIPHYYEKYGIDAFEISFDAFDKITPLTSFEFAVRPFIIK
ncbi:MAG: hypothetical protein ACI8XB_001495 [Patiriisocius sp.]|jgi:hypothetical protein